MILDDDRPFLEQAKIFLERTDDDMDIDIVASPKDALEKLEVSNYDAVVSDYMMPGMDGLEFLKKIRGELEDDIPFIMFTGKGREEVAMKALNLGADRYIQKGGDPKSQYGVLAQAIDQEVTHYRTKKHNKEILRDLEATFDTIENPIFLLDKDHKILRSNEATEEFFEVEGEKLTGEYCHKIAHGQDEPIENCPLERSLKTKEMEELEFSSEELDKYFLARTNPMLNEEGEIDKIVHQEIDITDLKKREKKIKESMMLFESIFHDPETYIGILDLDGKLIKANMSSLELIDSSMSDLKDTYFWNTPWWTHSGELQEKLKESIEKAVEGEICRFKAHHSGANGEEVEVDFSLRPVENDEGEIVRLIAEGNNVLDLRE